MKVHILNCLFDLKKVLKGAVGCGIYIYQSRQPSPTICLYAGIQFNSKLLNKKVLAYQVPSILNIYEEGKAHTPWAGQTQCGQDTVSTRQGYLFAVLLRPHSATE